MSSQAQHTIYRITEGEPVEVDGFTSDITHYQLSTPATLVAEQTLVDWFAIAGEKAGGPGQFRIVVHAVYSDTHMVTVDRPMPLPEKWAALRMWGDTGRPSKFFADNVLKQYPGSTVELVGEHLEVFGQHYCGEISTAELATRTGYVLPEGHRRPQHPRADIPADKT